jgi:hypothetical protein
MSHFRQITPVYHDTLTHFVASATIKVLKTATERGVIALTREEKRAAGLCTFGCCENPNEGRTLDRCREHGGVNPLPARAHRSLQVSGWRRQWEG